MYTIFKNDTSIILTDDRNIFGSEPYLKWEDYRSFERCERAFHPGGSTQYIYANDMALLWDEFRSNFTIIEASGGIVANRNRDLLFILRHDKWDLPKGKIEKGESREAAAVREVREECGFTELQLRGFVATTYHIYSENNKDILKLSHWYDMYSDETNLTPQIEEGITRLLWADSKAMGRILENSYPNIRLLLTKIRASDR